MKPGLYEMKIMESLRDEESIEPVYEVRFEERVIEDIAKRYNNESFKRVRKVSEHNDKLYSQWISPFVQWTE